MKSLEENLLCNLGCVADMAAQRGSPARPHGDGCRRPSFLESPRRKSGDDSESAYWGVFPTPLLNPPTGVGE